MRERQQVPAALTRLALHQGGVVSRAQVEGTGLSRHALARLTRSGVWSALTPGIYVTSSSDPTWHQQAWAGILLGGDGARLGGSAAGFLHDLMDSPPEEILVLVPHHRTVRSRAPWTFQRERPQARSWRTVGEPPRLTLEDTVLDLCAEATSGQLVHWVTKAVQTRRTSHRQLRDALDARTRFSDRLLVRDLLADVGAGAHSPLEIAYLRDVERAHGLPRGSRQSPLPHVGRLSRSGFSDVYYDAYALLVELDGRAGHTGTGRFTDMQRDNASITAGIPTLRYGWWDVLDHPCEVAWQVGEILVQRGWSGLPVSCSRCAGVSRIG